MNFKFQVSSLEPQISQISRIMQIVSSVSSVPSVSSVRQFGCKITQNILDVRARCAKIRESLRMFNCRYWSVEGYSWIFLL